MTRLFSVSTLIAAALILAGCDELGEFISDQRFKEDFHFTQALKPGGSLTLENMNGSVEIAGWEKDSVEINGTKYASTESALKAMKIDVVGTGDAVRIRTVAPSGHRGSYGAKYMIRVPGKIRLDRVESSNGSIRIDSLEGAARLHTSNGSMRVFRLAGTLEARTSNGAVELNEVRGGAVVRTSNGSIRADGVRGAFDATTSNGSITARLSDPEPRTPVKLTSSNGGIDLTLDTVRENDIRVATSNSSITVRMPQTVNAQLRAHTSNSSITSDFEVRAGGTISKRHLEGALGTGGPLIDLSTSNGSIKLLRR